MARGPGQAPVLRPDDGRAARLDPLVTADDLDEDVGELDYSVDDHYRMLLAEPPGDLPDLDGALRSIFEDLGRPEHAPADAPRVPASALCSGRSSGS